jgi:hypothetical protein
MSAELYLPSIWERCERNSDRKLKLEVAALAKAKVSMNDLYTEICALASANGGYYCNDYNARDVMWAMGLAWPGTIGTMLDVNYYLLIERARELVTMIKARPLTEERLRRHYLEIVTNGVNNHPVVGVLVKLMPPQSGPPDFDCFANLLRCRRKQLLQILQKSIALNEPLFCWL